MKMEITTLPLSADFRLENRSGGPAGALLALSVESELQILLGVLFGIS